MNSKNRVISAALILLICASTSISAFSGLLATSYAAATNLIENNGFETAADNNIPSNWYSDGWGNNEAAFTYDNSDAHTGTRSAKTTVSGYIDGDAKWIFSPISVEAGKDYLYSDWYKASAATHIWAQYTKTDGSFQYAFLKVVSPSPTWSQASATFTTPADVTKVSIFHVLAANGQLQIDDTSLTKQSSDCQPSIANGVIDGNLEGQCLTGGFPTGWSSVQYGTTDATFSHTDDAHDGSHALGVNGSNNTAEVGFVTDLQNLQSSQRYMLNFWQKGSTYLYAYLAFTLNDGSTQYKSLMSVPSSLGEWSEYSDYFITPANLKKTNLTIATSGTGTFTIDSVRLSTLQNQNPATFNQGMVSLTFDDGSASTYTNGFSTLKQNGYKGTFYLNAGSIGKANYMTASQIVALNKDGQEIGSHLYHHSDIAQIDDATLRSELAGNIFSLQNIVSRQLPISSFASPYGSYTSGRINTAMEYHKSHRNTDGRLNTKADFNIRQIHGRLVTPTTTITDIKNWLAEAKANRAWLVLVYHEIAASPAGNGEVGYNVSPAQFSNQLSAIKQSGLPVKTVQSALTNLQSQL